MTKHALIIDQQMTITLMGYSYKLKRAIDWSPILIKCTFAFNNSRINKFKTEKTETF